MTGERKVEIGSAEWAETFKEAAKAATREAADSHLAAGLPIHFIDTDGDICEKTADGKVRKVTKEEIEAFLTARRKP